MIEIYRVTNVINRKQYVGQTNQGIFRRLHQHSKADSLLGRAIRKYGIDNFTIESLACTNDRDEANDLEHKHVLDTDCVVPKGYNANEYGRLVGGDVIASPWFIYLKPQYTEIMMNETFQRYLLRIMRLANKQLDLKISEQHKVSSWKQLWEAIGCKGKATQAKVRKFLNDYHLVVIGDNKCLKLNSAMFKVYY